MFKNLKLGVKLGLGFGILILIAATLGGVAVLNMQQVRTASQRLSLEYVPEVAIANNLERSSLASMYAMRGYSLSEQPSYWEEGEEHLAAVQSYLTEAEAHADKYPSLVQLKEDVVVAAQGVEKYTELANTTNRIINAMAVNRENMDKAAGRYMQNCADFLDGQNRKMAEDISAGKSEAALVERLEKITIVNDIIDLGNDTRVKNFKSQATREPAEMQSAMENFPKMEEKFEALSLITRSADDIERIKNTRAAAAAYGTAMKNFLDNFLELQELNKERGAAGDEVLEASKGTAMAGVEATQTRANDAVDALGQASTVMIVGLCVALVVGVIIAFFLTRVITKPVLMGVAFAQNMSEGDFTKMLDIDQKDEIGTLAKALNDMVGKLRSVVHDVQTATDNVASGSEELSASAQSLSQGATEQAASIEEVSASMEEMSSNIQQNAENAKETETISEKVYRDAEQSGEAVNQAVDAMKNIAEKITVIEEIARQTNLLALNAAIEAARAGEHGKGFAVVAAEVRKLAERSGEAANEISELSTSTVQVADNAGKMLQQLVPDIRRTAELVQEITAASGEMNSGAEQINKAVQQLDQVIQQNASGAEEMASTSEELSSQGQQLQETMSFFMVDTQGSGSRKVSVRSAQPKRLESGSASRKDAKSGGSEGEPVSGVALEMDSDGEFERF